AGRRERTTGMMRSTRASAEACFGLLAEVGVSGQLGVAVLLSPARSVPTRAGASGVGGDPQDSLRGRVAMQTRLVASPWHDALRDLLGMATSEIRIAAP